MSILMTDLIRVKKEKRPHTHEEIRHLIKHYSQGQIPDYQMAAWAMAVVLNGMTTEETYFLTEEMKLSGLTLDLKSIAGVKVDKHSTGGVGDKTSMILGPIVAAAGIPVPMIAGRGLGHTGGTLDKLESIPGFSTQVSSENFKKQIREIGICIMGQTAEICPADKKLYALRDVTSTIDSFPLICASIMSKKLAEGIDALVLDVKFGSGAFMKTAEDAEKLAKLLVGVGQKAQKTVHAYLTDMNQPLGRWAGNALEIKECVEILKNEDSDGLYADTRELSLQLAGAMIYLGGKAISAEEGYAKANAILTSGKGFEKFLQLCELQGGNLKSLPQPKNSLVVAAPSSGFVSEYNTERLGIASLLTGAGRVRTDDRVDPTAGVYFHKKLGDPVSKGEPLFSIYGADPQKFEEAKTELLKFTKIGPEKTKPQPLILKRIS